MRYFVVAVAVALSGCAQPGYHYAQGDFFHQTPNDPPPTSQDIARQREAERLQTQAQAAWQEVIQKAESRGYRLVTSFNDLVLDGKQLANANAKIMLMAFYRKIGEIEYVYPTQYDAYQGVNGFPILTEDAQRPLREYFMSVECAQSPMGCRASVGGHMTTCRHLNPLLANYPPEPRLNVEVVIQ